MCVHIGKDKFPFARGCRRAGEGDARRAPRLSMPARQMWGGRSHVLPKGEKMREILIPWSCEKFIRIYSDLYWFIQMSCGFELLWITYAFSADLGWFIQTFNGYYMIYTYFDILNLYCLSLQIRTCNKFQNAWQTKAGRQKSWKRQTSLLRIPYLECIQTINKCM